MDDNKTYRIRTKVGGSEPYNLSVALEQEYTTFDVLSMKITDSDSYRLHNSAYGVIVGRVNANGGFGVPNAKISLFVEMDYADGDDIREIYPYVAVGSRNGDGIRYNLLPDNKVDDCHQVIGTMPNKTYLLENDVLMEVFDKYYKFTTRTNGSGDYMLCGVPVGSYTLHMDLDLSDCGILSQRPRDFVYKGYTIEQFENPNQFKVSTELDSLSQVISQDTTVTVNPFWGSSENGDTIGITRADIDVPFKFEPTCVFMGSVVSDAASNGVSKECIPTDNMGAMDEMVTGEGTIEMIRKTPGGDVESFEVKGTQLINADGVWCYQIPMNLDYMVTDEYGNMVPTDNPEKGVATRTRVRFRVSLQESSDSLDGYYRAKVLVPNNPQLTETGHEEYDYNFGTYTRDDSYRDLFWNNVYSVKSYIPRFGKSLRWKTEKFSGIKHCNIHGNNNPIPYDNIRIKLPFMFTLLCALIKAYIRIVGFINMFKNLLLRVPIVRKRMAKGKAKPGKDNNEPGKYVLIADGLCPDLEGWYFAPKAIPKRKRRKWHKQYWKNTFKFISGTGGGSEDGDADFNDNQSIDYNEGQSNDTADSVCLTANIDYLLACIEMNLAQEYKVINFDFYNDWINGTLYIPRWKRYIKRKRSFWIFGRKIEKVRGCMDNPKIFSKTRRYMQLCSLKYRETLADDYSAIYSKVSFDKSNKYHKKHGRGLASIFGKNGGLVHEEKTMQNQYVYYLKPCDWRGTTKKVNLFATDVILLGSLNTCDKHGIPQMFKFLSSSSYKMPTNLALTNMDTDGPLYATKDGTTCSGQNSFGNTGIRMVNGDGENTTLTNEVLYYKGTDGAIVYGEDDEYIDYSDTMPITEAAGISWNYSGPGQGKNNSDKMYYPGGHFLGISCVNSQTNIKSCINLGRICEIGTTMSERKEIVRRVAGKADGTGDSIQYTYNVPTGFISKDEVIEADARAMFATLNHRRLIATKLDATTGYYTYDMDYLRPEGFNGEMRDVVFNIKNSPYNAAVQTEDEVLPNVSVAGGRDDYDPEAFRNTQRRTLEYPVSSYYLFRFGLTNDDIYKGRITENQKRRFLRNDGSSMYLPQYENSFYFYFGLKDGATALDEFNKQFFSTCAHESTIRRTETLSVESSSNAATLVGEITIDMEGLMPPYSIKVLNSDGVDITNGKFSEYDEAILVLGVGFGDYTVVVEDGKGISYSESINVGKDSIAGDMKPYHFNMESPVSSGQWYYGGFIGVSNIALNGVDLESVPITVMVEGGSSAAYTPGETAEVYVSAPGEYKVYLQYDAGEGVKKALLGTCVVKDSSEAELTMGDSKMLDVYKDLAGKWYKNSWWYPIDSAASTPENIWKVKHSVFAQGNEDEGRYIFNSKVYSTGDRFLFGNVQNADSGIDDRKVYSSADASSGEIPEGYYLSDRNAYWQTINEGGATAPFGSVPVYNRNIVGGGVCGYINGEKGNGLSVNVLNSAAFDSLKNYGCVVKERWTNEVEAAWVDSSGRITFRESKIEPYYGTVYPIFFYPSIYRPFYAHALYVTICQSQVRMLPSSTGLLAPTVVDMTDNCKTEMELYNGITYNNTFNKDSTAINGVKVERAIEREGKDGDGITKTIAITKRQSLYGKDVYYEYPWVIESDFSGIYHYQIAEGTPSSYVALETLLTDDENAPAFFDNVLWEKTSNGKYKFYGAGDISQYEDEEEKFDEEDLEDLEDDEEGEDEEEFDIERYFIIPRPDFLEYLNEAVALHHINGTWFVASRYNDNAPDNNEGEQCIVEIKGSEASFTVMKNGITVKKTVKGSGNDEASIYTGFKDALKDAGVTLDRKIKIKWDTPWITTLRELNGGNLKNARKITLNDNTEYSFNPDKETIIGFYRGENEKGYSDIIRVFAYACEGGAYKTQGATVYLGVEPMSSTIPATGGTQTLKITANVGWSVSSNVSWITLDKTSGSGTGQESIVATIAENPNGYNRIGYLTFSATDMDDVEVTITQQASTTA